MKFIRGLVNIPKNFPATVITIGNFDGVHLGHQALIAQVLKEAQENLLASLLITFDPQPMEYFFKHAPKISRLMRLRDKYAVLEPLKIEYFLSLRFNEKLAALSAEAFVEQILCQKLGMKVLIIGEDFRFGQGRKGNVDLLQLLAKKHHFSVKIIPKQMDKGERISSTLVRQALAQGDFIWAEALLGRQYTISGKIEYGSQLGRQYGVPTANLNLHRQLVPISGIFAVQVLDLSANPLPAVAYVGYRPTLGGVRVLLEVHIFNFNVPIYGKNVRVVFLKKIRDDQKFTDLDLMIQQIHQDILQVKLFFKI